MEEADNDSTAPGKSLSIRRSMPCAYARAAWTDRGRSALGMLSVDDGTPSCSAASCPGSRLSPAGRPVRTCWRSTWRCPRLRSTGRARPAASLRCAATFRQSTSGRPAAPRAFAGRHRRGVRSPRPSERFAHPTSSAGITRSVVSPRPSSSGSRAVSAGPTQSCPPMFSTWTCRSSASTPPRSPSLAASPVAMPATATESLGWNAAGALGPEPPRTRRVPTPTASATLARTTAASIAARWRGRRSGASRLRTISPALANRASGRGARDLRIAAFHPSPSPGTRVRGGGGNSFSRLQAASSGVAPSNGSVPVTIS